MKLNEVINKMNEIKSGTYARFTFTSKPTLKAEARKNGYEVVKTTITNARVGASYKNMRNPETPQSTAQNNFEYVVDNKVVYNRNKDTYYVEFYVDDNYSNESHYEILHDGKVVNGDIHDYVTPSYFAPRKDCTKEPMRRVKIDGIISIKQSHR